MPINLHTSLEYIKYKVHKCHPNSQALDTASLLGGNEVMVAQLFKEVERRTFSEEEKPVIEWALELLWKDQDHSHQKDGFPAQTDFSHMFLPDVQRDLPSK